MVVLKVLTEATPASLQKHVELSGAYRLKDAMCSLQRYSREDGGNFTVRGDTKFPEMFSSLWFSLCRHFAAR